MKADIRPKNLVFDSAGFFGGKFKAKQKIKFLPVYRAFYKTLLSKEANEKSFPPDPALPVEKIFAVGISKKPAENLKNLFFKKFILKDKI